MTTKSEDVLNRCKGAAVIITACAGLLLGVLNWFKEVRDPKAKAGYQEVTKQVDDVNKDMHSLADTVKAQQEMISALQQWILFQKVQQVAAPIENKIRKAFSAPKRVAMPAPRAKAPKWDALQSAE